MSDTDILAEMLSAVSEEVGTPSAAAPTSSTPVESRITLGDVPFQGETVAVEEDTSPIEERAKNALSEESFAKFMEVIDACKVVGTGDTGIPVGREIPNMNLRMTETHVITTMGGYEKAILIEEFLDIFSNAAKRANKLESMEPMQLPPNVFNFACSDKTAYINTYHPEQIREISHANRDSDVKTYKIPFPNMIIGYTLAKRDGVWAVNDVRYYVTPKKLGQLPTDKFIMEETPSEGIYHVPFPNFYDDGRMCYGGNSMPSRHSNNLRGLDYYYQVIFCSNFNNDLGIRGVRDRYEPRDWFKHLKALKEFPYEELYGVSGR